ncbi:DUF2637 domain-containing protein [Kitasatospora sp. NPDC101801]|uniref:DUF2637 domain-containing protein n=1 Tax=Kitasatospora sp. NPDC101801 TaxID=3364103 RepID=UPI0037F859EA
MTTTVIPPAPTPVTFWDRVAVITLGMIGFVLSYDALRQMAVAIHVRGPLTYLFPLIIDGFIAYGVRALLVLRAAPWAARAYAWGLFAGATAASVWANALHAIRLNHLPIPGDGLQLGDGVVGFLSTLAPLALGGSVHLYILIARHALGTGLSADGPGTVGPDRESSADSAPPVHAEPRWADDLGGGEPLPQCADSEHLPLAWTSATSVPDSAEVADWAPGNADWLADDEGEAVEAADGAGASDRPSAAGAKPIGRPAGTSMEQLLKVSHPAVADSRPLRRTGRPVGASMERLLEASRPAVQAHGRPSRPVVERAVREANLPMGSTRFTVLMDQLRKEFPHDPVREHPPTD